MTFTFDIVCVKYVKKQFCVKKALGILGSDRKQWERIGSVVECLSRDRRAAGSMPHQRHFVVILEQDPFILA